MMRVRGSLAEPGTQSFRASVVGRYELNLVDRTEAQRWVPDIDERVGAGSARRTPD
jgi:hypothetical protein